MYMYDASLYWNQLFPELPAVFFHQDKFYNLHSNEMWNLEFYCSQWKYVWLSNPEPAYACGSSGDSNSFLEHYRLDFFRQRLSGQF